jgi:hypothetical protein
MFPVCLFGTFKKGAIEDESPLIGRPFETNARILPNCGQKALRRDVAEAKNWTKVEPGDITRQPKK